MEIKEILTEAAKRKVSDIFLIGGLPLTFKIGKQLIEMDENGARLMPEELEALIHSLYVLVNRVPRENPVEEDDFSFAVSGCGRFRANVFRQRGTLSAVIRVIQFGVPNAEEFGIPEEVLKASELNSGLVLVTGTAGSGKSTTLACMIDRINANYAKTIITMEDPIEIVHSHKKSIVIQREISTDTETFESALKAALREAPDVMLIGEIRDGETVEAAMTAAETGQLLLSTLHTMSAADTVDRILDFFPEKKQPQIRAQLSRVLRCVVCQKLVNSKEGKPVPAFEIMMVTPAIQNLIREGKTYQFNSLIREGGKIGMQTMSSALLKLYENGTITKETLMENAPDRAQMERKLENR